MAMMTHSAAIRAHEVLRMRAEVRSMYSTVEYKSNSVESGRDEH